MQRPCHRLEAFTDKDLSGFCERSTGQRKFFERFKTLRALRFLTHAGERSGAVASAFVRGGVEDAAVNFARQA